MRMELAVVSGTKAVDTQDLYEADVENGIAAIQPGPGDVVNADVAVVADVDDLPPAADE